MPNELKADAGCCEEGSALSPVYIPCNRPAKFVVEWREIFSRRPFRMCESCASYNVKYCAKLGAKIIGEYKPDTGA